MSLTLSAPIIAAYDRHRPLADKPFRAGCYAPYTSLMFDTVGLVRACCVNYAHVLGDLRQARLPDIWRGVRIEQLRRALREYDFGLGCGQCAWKISCGDFDAKDLTNSSLVTYKFDRLTVPDDGEFWPRHLEFHVSNVCNLACTTCWGEFSTIIRSRREKLPPLARPYDDRFFEDLAPFLPRLEEAQFLGGEPFLIAEHHRIWDALIEQRLSPRCHTTTNGTLFNERVERVLTSLPMSLSVSMDGATPATFEKLRVNAKFDEVLANLERYRTACGARGGAVGVNMTLSRLNWFEFGDLLLMMDDRGVPVSVSTLWEPRRYSLYTLHPSALREVLDALRRQEARLLPKLTLNRQVWINHLGELTRHCELTTQTAATGDEPAATPAAQRRAVDDYRAELQTWAPPGSVVVMRHDADYLVTAIEAPPEAEPAWRTAVGQTTDDFVVTMKRAYGGRVHVLEEDYRSDAVHRLIQFFDGPAPMLLRGAWFGAQPGAGGAFVFAARPELDRRLQFGG